MQGEKALGTQYNRQSQNRIQGNQILHNQVLPSHQYDNLNGLAVNKNQSPIDFNISKKQQPKQGNKHQPASRGAYESGGILAASTGAHNGNINQRVIEEARKHQSNQKYQIDIEPGEFNTLVQMEGQNSDEKSLINSLNESMIGRHHQEVFVSKEDEQHQRQEIKQQIKRALRESSEPPPLSKFDPTQSQRKVTDDEQMISIDIPIQIPKAQKYTSNVPIAHYVPVDQLDVMGGTPRKNLKSNMPYSVKQSLSVVRSSAQRLNKETDFTLTIGSLSKKGQGYYNNMIPSFTNTKRMNLYVRDTRRGGFDYINWEIEEELWRFQKEIETKFLGSEVNQKFKFPLIDTQQYEIEIVIPQQEEPDIQSQINILQNPLRLSAQRKDIQLSSSQSITEFEEAFSNTSHLMQMALIKDNYQVEGTTQNPEKKASKVQDLKKQEKSQPSNNITGGLHSRNLKQLADAITQKQKTAAQLLASTNKSIYQTFEKLPQQNQKFAGGLKSESKPKNKNSSSKRIQQRSRGVEDYSNPSISVVEAIFGEAQNLRLAQPQMQTIQSRNEKTRSGLKNEALTMKNLKGLSKLNLGTTILLDGKLKKQRQNQSIEELKNQKIEQKESPQTEVLASDLRSTLPVFTTQKMMDKSESLLIHPSNSQQHKVIQANRNQVLQSVKELPIANLLLKDINNDEQLRAAKNHNYPQSTKNDQKSYHTALTQDEDLNGVVATLFDRSIIQTEPQMMFQSLVLQNQLSSANKIQKNNQLQHLQQYNSNFFQSIYPKLNKMNTKSQERDGNIRNDKTQQDLSISRNIHQSQASQIGKSPSLHLNTSFTTLKNNSNYHFSQTTRNLKDQKSAKTSTSLLQPSQTLNQAFNLLVSKHQLNNNNNTGGGIGPSNQKPFHQILSSIPHNHVGEPVNISVSAQIDPLLSRHTRNNLGGGLMQSANSGFSKTLLIPNQGQMVNGLKVDKNLIRNSSPAKTNLERLNQAKTKTSESVERQGGGGNSFVIGPSGLLNQVQPVHNIRNSNQRGISQSVISQVDPSKKSNIALSSQQKIIQKPQHQNDSSIPLHTRLLSTPIQNESQINQPNDIQAAQRNFSNYKSIGSENASRKKNVSHSGSRIKSSYKSNEQGKPQVELVSDEEFLLQSQARHVILGNTYSYHHNLLHQQDMNCSVIEEGFSQQSSGSSGKSPKVLRAVGPSKSPPPMVQVNVGSNSQKKAAYPGSFYHQGTHNSSVQNTRKFQNTTVFGMSPIISKGFIQNTQRKDTSKSIQNARGTEERLSQSKRVVSGSPKFQPQLNSVRGQVQKSSLNPLQLMETIRLPQSNKHQASTEGHQISTPNAMKLMHPIKRGVQSSQTLSQAQSRPPPNIMTSTTILGDSTLGLYGQHMQVSSLTGFQQQQQMHKRNMTRLLDTATSFTQPNHNSSIGVPIATVLLNVNKRQRSGKRGNHQENRANPLPF